MFCFLDSSNIGERSIDQKGYKVSKKKQVWITGVNTNGTEHTQLQTAVFDLLLPSIIYSEDWD